MAPFAGLIFLLICFYLLTNQFRQTESNVRTESLPFSKTHACIPENDEVTISLTHENHLSFAVNSRKAQAMAIQQVAQRHKINITPEQVLELEKIPCLQTDVENLPRYLALPAYERNRSTHNRQFSPLSEQQLVECVASAKKAVQTLYLKPMYVSLRIDAETKAGNVNHLLELLETNGYHRFLLRTQD